jgi:hypothetical protein
MKFIDLPTEQTTAVTDVILAGLALGAAVHLLGFSHFNPWKAGVWAWAFGLLALAAVLGTVVHGVQMSLLIQVWLWRPLNLLLGLVIALFGVGVVYDLWGLAVSRQSLPVLLLVAIIFWSVTLTNPTNFTVFILYEAVAMLFALGAYGWLTATDGLVGAGWMMAGVLVTMVAAAVQALWNGKERPIRLIWQFDQNGLYHLIQMVGVILLLAGLRLDLMEP